MSEKYFFNKFTNSLTDILDQIQLEQLPAELDANKKVISENWSCKDFLNFFVTLYFKYIRIVTDVEDSYNQIIHPQLRKYIKRFLKTLLCRVVQVKKEIIFYNNPILTLPGILYVFLDDYLIDLKKEPRDLDLPIPNYFRESYKNEVKVRNALISQQLINCFGDNLPEEDIYQKHYIMDVKFDEAICILQNFEMARQGLTRVEKLIKEENKKTFDHDIGTKVIIGEDESKKLVIENIISHYKLKHVKYNEIELLKMIPQIDDYNYKEIAEEIRKDRKVKQMDERLDYEDHYKTNLKERFNRIEKEDYAENMKNERREWITDFIQLHNGEPPVFVKNFYLRNEVEKKEELNENQKKV